MQKIILWICFVCSFQTYAQHTDLVLKHKQGHSFYISQNLTKDKLLIFLHGGVRNDFFKQKAENISVAYIFEQNTTFLEKASLYGFDLLVPLTNNTLNWLEKPQQSFEILQKIVASLSPNYKEIYIAGFSDGGTGSYKIFYNNPKYFAGLWVCNGYPQHRNFNQKVTYNHVKNKKIIFMGTYKDKVIPYEFLMHEYVKQKVHNANTFLYLSKGNHSFTNYNKEDIQIMFDILTNKIQNRQYKPIQGFVKNDKLVALYPFRKKIVQKYSFGKDTYEENLKQQKKYR